MQSLGIPSREELLLMSKGWKNGSTKGWRKIRERILARDGYACQRCGETEGQLHVDHIIPKRLMKGIEGDMDSNLQTLCRACNLQKGGFFEQALTPPTLHERYLPQNVSQSHE